MNQYGFDFSERLNNINLEMKLLLFAALIAFVVCDTDALHAEISEQSQEYIDKITGKNPNFDGEITIWLFESPNCCASPNEKLNSETEDKIKSKILSTEKGKTYFFEKIDVTDEDMKGLLKYMQIDPVQANFGPFVAISCEGFAAWDHTKQAVDKINGKLSEYERYKATAKKNAEDQANGTKKEDDSSSSTSTTKRV